MQSGPRMGAEGAGGYILLFFLIRVLGVEWVVGYIKGLGYYDDKYFNSALFISFLYSSGLRSHPMSRIHSNLFSLASL